MNHFKEKFGLGPNLYQIENKIYSKSYQILCRKRISMLTGLKMLSLICKCVFYRPEHNAKRGHHGIEFRRFLNAKNEIYQRIEFKE